jgi:hypothetical protein
MRHPARRHHPELGQMAAQGVDQLRALAHQKIAAPEQHRARLALCRLHRDKAHGRTRGRLHNRFRVGCIVLLALHERLHIDRRDQPHLMPECRYLPAPEMRRAASLHRNDAARLIRQDPRSCPRDSFRRKTTEPSADKPCS